MKSFVLTNAAIADLKAIARNTERLWGKSKRNDYLTQLHEVLALLAESPLIGETCDDIRNGCRKFPYISHVLFYRLSSSRNVEIIRILHQSMDVSTKL